jgi:hypothetical protein
MTSSSTYTLYDSMEWAKKFNFGRNFAIGSNIEPAMTSGNIVMQTILGPPFCWRWNRIVTGFFTSSGTQDYTVMGTRGGGQTVGPNWFIVDNNNSSQQVTTAGTTGLSYPVFNQTLGGTTTDGSVIWTNRGNFTTAGLDFNVSDVYSFNWMETVSVQDPTLVKWFEIESKINLGLDSTEGRPRFVSAQLDDGFGDITFRLMPTPDNTYPTVITLQQKPPLFTSVNQTWSPIPDEYGHIYNWGFLALMWMFADDSRFTFANQKFVSSLLATNQGLTQTEINIFLNNWQYVTGQPIEKGNTMAQGIQSRQV